MAHNGNRVSVEEFSAAGANRATKIARIAISDTVNAVVGRSEGDSGISRASIAAAIAHAAHDTVVDLFPPQLGSVDAGADEGARQVRNEQPKTDGNSLEKRAANGTAPALGEEVSRDDEPDAKVKFVTSKDSSKWGQDLISQLLRALGVHRDEARPLS